jgi:CheY-like chemotaxis protein
MANEDQNCKILVADDEPEVVDLVRIVLDQEGYVVLSAGDGDKALTTIQTERPDLVLLDVRMPKMSGLTVLRYLREDPELATIPVIMLSVVTSYPEVRSALQRGAVAYLSKPFELRELVRLVDRVLEMDAVEREGLRQRALKNLSKPW